MYMHVYINIFMYTYIHVYIYVYIYICICIMEPCRLLPVPFLQLLMELEDGHLDQAEHGVNVPVLDLVELFAELLL